MVWLVAVLALMVVILAVMVYRLNQNVKALRARVETGHRTIVFP